MQRPQVHSDAAGVLARASSPQSFLCYLKTLKHAAPVESHELGELSREGALLACSALFELGQRLQGPAAQNKTNEPCRVGASISRMQVRTQQEFKSSLGCILNSRPAWATYGTANKE